MMMLLEAIDWFFHARAGEKTCVLCGYLRIFYAFLILCDKALWTIDFEFFFLSGRLPYEATSKDPSLANHFTIFALAPESDFLYLFIHLLSMVCAGLLLLGIAPRIQLVLVHICMLSFQHHNAIIWDGEDAMFRVWNFLMMFLPLHRVTLYDLLSTNDKYRQEDSWPMWPFRLWQIEICFVYAGAAMGKLASYRWQQGVALYHVIHITDFFGGAFAPDILYNRFGPLMLMSYASLFVESLCIIFIWPKATRLFTLAAVIGLHLGIELSMNMHCFEWLAMMGWMFFLAEPEFQKPLESKVSRHGVTVLLLILLSVFAIDTAPIEELCDAAPALFESSRHMMQRVKYFVQPKVVTRYLAPLGLSQDVWNMFMAAPDEVFTYEATIKLYNDSEVVWNQPHWDDMNWLQKKRWQRPMTYYDSLADGHQWPIMEAFARGIAIDHGGIENVRSVDITVHIDRPPPPNGLGFFDTAKQRRFRQSTKQIFKLNLCDDFDARCPYWSRVGSCHAPQHWKVMVGSCRRSCELCYDTSVIHVGSRIALIYPSDQEYYAVTVVDVANEGRRFRIEYDDYEFEHERYEWLDRTDMRFRKFKLLSLEEDPDMAEPTPLTPAEPSSEPSEGFINRPVQLTAQVKVNRGSDSATGSRIDSAETKDAQSTKSEAAPETDEEQTANTQLDRNSETKRILPHDGIQGAEGAADSSDVEHSVEFESGENPTEAANVDQEEHTHGTPPEQAAHVVEADSSTRATNSAPSKPADVASSGSISDQEDDHTDSHVKLGAKVEIDPRMEWRSDGEKSNSDPPNGDVGDRVAPFARDTDDESINVNKRNGSPEDNHKAESNGALPDKSARAAESASANDMKKTLESQFNAQHGLDDQPLVKLSASVKVNPGMVWLNNPMKSESEENKAPALNKI